MMQQYTDTGFNAIIRTVLFAVVEDVYRCYSNMTRWQLKFTPFSPFQSLVVESYNIRSRSIQDKEVFTYSISLLRYLTGVEWDNNYTITRKALRFYPNGHWFSPMTSGTAFLSRNTSVDGHRHQDEENVMRYSSCCITSCIRWARVSGRLHHVQQQFWCNWFVASQKILQ